ncbi:uncharacterized protein LOC124370524 [Homalodisca vitripennis]|uniref:uncharacterized protein LOC124370524 n=1 Tax=Homalodisca vitripennis TaxID=197043 RepID=UPI001EECF191|nr:uncharacterized protein LOC124370524 [Homalodisca vitripennis]
MKKEDFIKIEDSWLCPVCVVSSGGSAVDRQVAAALTAVDKPGVEITPNIELVDILNEMKSFRLEIKETNKEFRNQLENYSEWIVDNGKKIEEVGNKIEKAIEDIGFLRQENANLKKIVNDLSSKVNALEQSSKDNVVEISGVPHKEKDDILNIIGKISDAIGFLFKEDSVDNCYRYKSIDGSRPGIIVVRFVRKLDKEAFMNKRRVKKNLNSRDIGFMDGDASVIYFNESLTQEIRKLLNMARAIKREKQYTYLWVRNGRIFMRKNQGDRFVTINSIEDFNKLA